MNLEAITKLCRYHFGSIGWIAVDEDLNVYFYKKEPDINLRCNEWGTLISGSVLVCTKYTGDKDWKNTLTSLANIERDCHSCENQHWEMDEYWYCCISLTNPNNNCAGYSMIGG